MATRHNDHVKAIDGLRTVAVLSVLLFHLHNTFLPGGYVGVDIFFTISGFVVTRSLVGHHFNRIGELLLYFYARRLVRIMPALIVMLLVTILVSDMVIPNSWLSTAPQDVGKAAFLGFSNIVLSMQTDSYFSPSAEYNQYLHTWSLGVEEQFYFIFPFLMFWHQKRKQDRQFDLTAISVIVGLSIASLLLSAWLMESHQRYSFYLMPPRFWELGLGMILCLTEGRWTPWLGRLKGGLTTIISMLAVAIIAISFGLPEGDSFPFPLAILPVAGTVIAIILCVSRQSDVLASCLSIRPMVAIGKWSYSIYLWHWPVFVLMRWTTGLNSPVQMLVGVILSIGLGAASYYGVEGLARNNPIIRNTPKWQMVGGSLAVVLLMAGLGHKLIQHQRRFALVSTRDTQAWYANADTRLGGGGRRMPDHPL